MARVIAIHPENPQDRLIKQAVEQIKNGAVAVIPTDSGYALACTLENKDARERIVHIRQVDKYHNFTLLCESLKEISLFAHVEDFAFKIIRKHTPGQYTFILKATKEVPRRLMNEKRKTIGIRVPGNPIIHSLLEELREPLMSVSLILPNKDTAENNPYEIEEELGNLVDLIIDGGYLEERPTTVVSFVEEDENMKVLREGAGEVSSLFE